MSSLAEGLSGPGPGSFQAPPPRSPSSHLSHPRNQPGMALTRLLNDPLPPMRSPPVSEAGSAAATNPARVPSFGSPQSRLGGPQPAYIPFAPPLSGRSSHDVALSSQGAFSDSVLCSTSRTTIERALEVFRRESLSVIDHRRSTSYSIAAVQEAFKKLDARPDSVQSDLWATWKHVTWLAELVKVPPFPLNPDKIALLLSVHVDLPCSTVVREMMRHRQTLLDPDQVILSLHCMEVAGKASKDYWPGAPSFVRSASHYPSTSLVRTLVNQKAAQTPAITGFAPRKGHESSRPIAHPAVSGFYPPQARQLQPIPAARPPPTLPPKRSLRELCAELPAILRDLRDLPDDPQIFDIAQLRFQNASSAPAYVPRMPDLVQAAVLYTNITALLCFPTYPIDAIKLAVFGLAFTPGPLGDALARSSPEFANQREFPRLNGRDMEKLLRDVTAVRDITRGGTAAIAEAETRDWQEWLRELRLDWKANEPPEQAKRLRPSQPAQSRKRAKLSPSPTDSENLRASVKTVSDRPSLSKKELSQAPPSDISTPAPSIAETASSPEGSTQPVPKKRGRPKKTKVAAVKKENAEPKGRKTTVTPSSSSRSSTPSSNFATGSIAASVTRAPLAPRWIPERKGKIPDQIAMPPIPPIRPSTRWLKQKKVRSPVKVVKVENVVGAETGQITLGGDTAGETQPIPEDDEEDEEEEEEEEAPRTIAASRPKRRGGLVMNPVDIESLWTLARSVGYTREALDDEAAQEIQP
ncbi:uncharacterized protein JCM15063_004455 [Sporobolomyces koalae]|uniref:uncharacterized protein n=1 Tax=Sporobolomyces koalae TaxID=500713 RepID=UPI00316F32F5